MIEQIKRIKPEFKTDVCVIIYGSRFGDQMRSFGPKYLYKDKFGKPILETQIKSIKDVYPKAEIILVGGYEIEKTLRYKTDDIRIVENQLFNETNEVEDLRLALNNTNKKHVITISSDLIFNKYAIQNITVNPSLVFDTKSQLVNSDLGITCVDRQVERIDLLLEKKWCHISYFESKHLNALKRMCKKANNKLFLFEIINKMINEGYIFHGVEPNSMLIKKIQTPDNLRKLSQQCVY